MGILLTPSGVDVLTMQGDTGIAVDDARQTNERLSLTVRPALPSRDSIDKLRE